MRSFFFLVLILFAAAFASCEDKNSSKQNKVETVLKEPAQPDSLNENNTNVKDVEPKADMEKQEGPLLVQEKFIPFMMKYGKEHQENKVRIKTRFGNIDVELFRDTPLHRANFLFLVNHNYFDKTFFHRVSENFVIQGGNSDLPGTNKKRHHIGNYLIPSEFDAGHKHVRGALAAAKYAKQNVSKASSPYEFYIVQSHRGAHHLDNEHTVFGRVIDGMDVVDSISKVPVDGSEWPIQNIYINTEIME
ncbi:MAG: peptidylprolyl isomerase [Salinimicrobium sp.]